MTTVPFARTKDPQARLDWRVDWSEWLGDDTIATSSFAVETGLTKDSEDNDTTTATVWLSGGTAGERYTVTNHIVTAGGRIDERTFRIEVRER